MALDYAGSMMMSSGPLDPRGVSWLAAIEALGWNEWARSREGRALRARCLEGTSAGSESAAPLVVVAAVHGDEWSTIGAALDLADELALRPAPRAVWIVPALNPDGVARAQKNNAADVDLNRNWPARNFTRVHKPGYDPGPAPLSEPESAALAAWLARVRPCGIVALHAPFACVNFDGPARVWADVIARACGWPVRDDIGYPTPGSLGTWVGVDGGVPIITIEQPAGEYEAFRVQARAALRAAVDGFVHA